MIPRFVLLLTAQTANSVGGWACAIALWGFSAYRYHAGPPAVALLTLCWAAPPAVLSPLLGVAVDRLGPQRALTLGYLAAAVAAASLANAGSLAGLGAAAVGYGVSRALTGPAAAALPPRIVAGEDLLAANALLGATGPAGQILGPLAASASLAVAGFRAVFLLDAASYLAWACAVAMLPVRPRPASAGRPARPRRHPGLLASLRAGLQARLVAASRRPGGSRGYGCSSGLPAAGMVLALLGVRARALALAGVAVAAGLVVAARGQPQMAAGRDC